MVGNGYFHRKSDARWIYRWRCPLCPNSVSEATGTETFGQNKRRVNDPLRSLFCSGISQRRAALILNIHHKTVARKLRFLAERARKDQMKYLKAFEKEPIEFTQFDEMETHEHTKLKPLSIALAVSSHGRKILGIEVSSMPARGVLAQKSVRKYGKRQDEREKGMKKLFETIKPMLKEDAKVLSDQNPKYPKWLKSQKETWIHRSVKGQRGCITGQGELKKQGFDQLFSLNHTAAMIRANVNRLFRRTWNTTKKAECLEDHLIIYMDFHNRVLT